MRILLFCIGLCVGVTGVPVGVMTPAQAQNHEPVTLQSLLDLALERNPSIRQTEKTWSAAETVIPQAGAWEDPELSVSISDVPLRSFSFSMEPMTGKQIQLMQRIPLRGIKRLETDMARTEAGMAEYLHADNRNLVFRDLKSAYYALFFTDKSLEITNKNKSLLEDFIRIAETKYAAGGGLQQDVLKAQVAFSRTLERIIMLERERAATVARINTLLNRNPQTPIPTVAEVTEPEFPHTSETLQNLAVSARPMLQAREADIRRAEFSHALAKKEYWPSIDVGVMYNQRQLRDDMIGVSVSTMLPVFGNRKQDRKVEQTALEIEAAQADYAVMENDVRFMTADLYAGILQDQKLLRLLSDTIIPQGTQSLESAIAGYRVDKVDFLMLLDNQMTLFDYEIEYYRILADYRTGIAELEWVVGQSLVEQVQ